MSTKLVALEKLSRKNRYGKCDWKVELEVDGTYAVIQYWVKYTKESLFDGLRKTCNCTIPREFAR